MQLETPHDPGWERSPKYSPTTAARLESAFSHLAQARKAQGPLLQIETQAILDDLSDIRFHNSAAPQCLRVWYLRGQAYLLQRRYGKAERSFANSLKYLSMDEDHLIHARLRYHCGLALHEQQRFPDAIAEFKSALSELNAHQSATHEDMIDLRFEILRRLASETFLFNLLEESLAYLRRSEEIAESVSGIDAATSWEWQGIVAWMFALVHQTSRAPKTAYERAKHAVECYRNAGLLSSIPRAELFAAECGMDWAARLLYDRVIPEVLTDVATLISDARLRLAALRTADSDSIHAVASDKEGDALGNLAYLRYQRLAGQGSHEQRLAELYTQIEHAKLIGDQALIGQAYLTCGDELAHGGQPKQACENYDKTIKHLRKVAPLLIARAERGIANGGHIPSDMV